MISKPTLERSDQLATETLNNEQLTVQKGWTLPARKLSSQLDQRQNTLSKTYHINRVCQTKPSWFTDWSSQRKAETAQTRTRRFRRGQRFKYWRIRRVKSRYDFLTQQKKISVRQRIICWKPPRRDGSITLAWSNVLTRRLKRWTRSFRKPSLKCLAAVRLSWVRDPDHLLTTGIEIMARTAWKTTAEYAIIIWWWTGIGLPLPHSIAVLQVRSTPFCVLDEARKLLWIR